MKREIIYAEEVIGLEELDNVNGGSRRGGTGKVVGKIFKKIVESEIIEKAVEIGIEYGKKAIENISDAVKRKIVDWFVKKSIN